MSMHFSSGINCPPYETADGFLQTTAQSVADVPAFGPSVTFWGDFVADVPTYGPPATFWGKRRGK